MSAEMVSWLLVALAAGFLISEGLHRWLDEADERVESLVNDALTNPQYQISEHTVLVSYDVSADYEAPTEPPPGHEPAERHLGVPVQRVANGENLVDFGGEYR